MPTLVIIAERSILPSAKLTASPVVGYDNISVAVNRDVRSLIESHVPGLIDRNVSFPISPHISIPVDRNAFGGFNVNVSVPINRDVTFDAATVCHPSIFMSTTRSRSVVVTNIRVCVSPRPLRIGPLPGWRGRKLSLRIRRPRYAPNRCLIGRGRCLSARIAATNAWRRIFAVPPVSMLSRRREYEYKSQAD